MVEVGQEVTVEVLDVDMDRERVSLSLKATQEDPWQQFARTHAIGQVVPGKVTKLVPFGAFVRVDEGIEGLVHISELAERHVEIPEQVVQVGDDDLRQGHRHRPRASPDLAVAQAGQRGRRRRRARLRPDAVRHGRRVRRARATTSTPRASTRRPTSGSRATTTQREEWERQYAEAHARWEAHKKQIEDAAEAEAEAAHRGRRALRRASRSTDVGARLPSEGTLATDEALAALREKLTGGD